MGLSLTCAFTLFVNTVVRDGKIPFEIATGNSKKINSSEVQEKGNDTNNRVNCMQSFNTIDINCTMDVEEE